MAAFSEAFSHDGTRIGVDFAHPGMISAVRHEPIPGKAHHAAENRSRITGDRVVYIEWHGNDFLVCFEPRHGMLYKVLIDDMRSIREGRVCWSDGWDSRDDFHMRERERVHNMIMRDQVVTTMAPTAPPLKDSTIRDAIEKLKPNQIGKADKKTRQIFLRQRIKDRIQKAA